jgi:hypothetical protein
MEYAGDNLVSTVRSVVEGTGGRPQMVAVFDEERIVAGGGPFSWSGYL